MNTKGLQLQPLAEAGLSEWREAVLARLSAAGSSGAASSTGPAGWVICGRTAPDATFGNGRALLAAGGLATSIRHEAGAEPRPITLTDVDAFCRVADALPHVAVVEPPCVPGASHAAERLASVARAFAGTGKHLMAVCADPAEVSAVVEMAATVAGGQDALRARPLVTVAIMPQAGSSAAHIAAAAGVPCLVALAPAFFAVSDWAEALIESFAAALAVVVETQSRYPGAPLGLAVPPGRRRPLDAAALRCVATAAPLARSFGLPLTATMLATHAGAPDWLASAENTFASLMCSMAGVAGIAGAGLLDGGEAVSLHELIMDAELFSYCSATAAGIPVDDDTIALDTIERVGIGGNALGERHTRRHLRDVWRPALFDRSAFEAWEREGRRQSYELAEDLVHRILSTPAAEPLPAETAARLITIAENSRKELT